MSAVSRNRARALLALAVVTACLSLAPVRADAAPQEKVKICHRTNSRTNPYNQVNDSKDGVVSGHANHTGPIFGPDVEKWGNIVPPIDPGLPDGLNWTAEGRAILDNGCEMPPDPGPIPAAEIADAACSGATPSVSVTVSNDADATDPASFTIRVNGVAVQTVGPIAPGDSQTVTLAGVPEDRVAVVDVLADGEVVASRVVTADCTPGPPPVSIKAGFGCVGTTPQGTLQVTNNGTAPLSVVLQVDGEQIGPAVSVASGTTESRTIDASRWEDQTATARVLVDGVVVATYTVTPDCQHPVARPAARIGGAVCPPLRTTVTLANDGDPASTVVFFIRVNDRPVQRSAALYGGDATTIVVDLARFEGRSAHVEAGYDDTVLIDRTIRVRCPADTGGDTGTYAGGGTGGDSAGGGSDTGGGSGGGGAGGEIADEAALPSVGSGVPSGGVLLGAGLLAAGAVLTLAGLRTGRPGRR
ncbi:hypothetical protein GON03_10355 [Nocardioides sp. MAH-18]|uniref:Uncharacterized protein n=1 Tax=Nocardioides agri TaxID=2682843 RepID=A0A6L6XRZ2_9ACTN|nr:MULTISPECIES: hypothetical protein [unclassified Nocardioides]MBA2954726.1 hypothetical protein [Nocardioides sp. CGMCC 1.13656]MVQ49582.1 hypothetical protein [Nocardioides sp. MAH-18]